MNHIASLLGATSKKDILIRAGYLSKQIRQHLFKLASIHDPESELHWLSEVDGWLEDINDNFCKTLISSHQIYEKLYENIDLVRLKNRVWKKAYLKNDTKATIQVYDNWREATKFINPLLEEFSKVPLQSFDSITDLKAYEDMISARKTSYTQYTLGTLVKA